MVKAQVIGAGVTYFSVEKVKGPDGQTRKDRNGNEVITELRHQALRGQMVEMSEREFERNFALGAVRKPSSDPLDASVPKATPFGVPMPTGDESEPEAFKGPVMGEPSPSAGLSDIELRAAAGALTPEQSAALEEQALSGVNDDSTEAISDRDYEGARVSALEAEIKRRNAVRSEEDQIRPEGTGSNGNVVHADLVAALESDDANREE